MKTTSKELVFAGALACLTTITFAVPEVSDVTMSQSLPDRTVTITYKLSEAPAVVTLDIETNTLNGTWESIGGENVQFVSGAVNRKVTLADKGANDLYTINWKADDSWPNNVITNGGARAKVTAWALDNTPDYMIVDISASAAHGSERYYTSTNFLPGGVMNPLYRTSSILMRKILAKGVRWNMGTRTEIQRLTDGREDMHEVELTNNYYIGVFEVTQSQWANIQTARPQPSYFQYGGDKAMRPVERVCYNEIRCAANSDSRAADYVEWPAAPYEGSFLGLLRDKTGIDFDLPSDAEWEYACRAGHGEGHWADGSDITVNSNDPNYALLGRNGVSVINTLGNPNVAANVMDTTTGATNGTAVCGSYRPNSWGLYDTHGNVMEWVLDWFSANATVLADLRGAVNTSANGNGHTVRSCAWYNVYTQNDRPGRRHYYSDNNRKHDVGFRLACRNGLK